MGRGMRGSLTTAAIVAGLLASAPAAMGQGVTDTFYFSHDDTIETHSSMFSFGPYDAEAQPDEQRLGFPRFLDAADDNDDYTVPPVEELREVFRFVVPDGDVNGSFTAQLNWANPTIDLDMYIYRERPNGTLDPAPVAQGATANDEEIATYTSPNLDQPVESAEDGTPAYVIYVDNWCSAEDDPLVDELRDFFGIPNDPNHPDWEPICGVVDEGIDEDDFSGKVEFAPLVLTNKLPSAGISGPTTARAGERLTFTGSGSDPDGQIVRYTFDLDGDGNFEYDNGQNPSVSRLYDQPGAYNVGVRVFDDRGGVGYSSLLLQVSGPPVQTLPGDVKPVAADPLLYSFKLNRPVFGGRKNRALVIRYRLRKRSRVELALYRGRGKKIRRVRRLDRGVRRAGRPYKVKLRSRGRRRGTYTLRLRVTPVDGSTPRKIYKLVSKKL